MEVSQWPVRALRFRFSSEPEQRTALEHPDFEAKARSGDEQPLFEARRRRQARQADND